MRLCALSAAMLTAGQAIPAQPGARPAEPSGPLSAQQSAPIDLTGYWVSVITEDWRWRMLTPPPGDVDSVPVNETAKKASQAFDGGKYGPAWTNRIDCRAYYGAGLMRMPTRLHITWAGPDTLKIESDWGQQTRLLHFRKADIASTGPSPQGDSYAQWEGQDGQGPRGFGDFALGAASAPGSSLRVITGNLSPGWLRRNGVPYSGKTQMTEWFSIFQDPEGKLWFDVTTRVEDPEYLTRPYITSSDFVKEPDGSKWSSHACVRME